MSTIAPTISLDQAGAYAFNVDRKAYIDGAYLNLGLFAAWKAGFGEKMGKEVTAAQVDVVPVAVRNHSSSTGFQTGAESFNLSVNSTDEGMQFRTGTVGRPIVMNKVELRQCGDQAGANRFLADRFKMTRAACEREYVQHVVAGGVVAYENSVAGYGPWFSFNGIDRATYGFAEHRAFGSQTNVLGGFSKATWANKPQTQNIVMDVASSFSTAGATQMFALRTRMRKYARNMKGSYALITEACLNNYKRTLSSQERYMKESDLNGGWIPMMFGDVPLYVEEYLPISTTYGGSTSATNKMSMLIFNVNSTYPIWTKSYSVSMGGSTEKMPGGRFEIGSMRRLQEQWAWAAELNIEGNLKTEMFAELGVLLNAETWA